MVSTKIEWTATYNADGTVTKGRSWNPIRGCRRVSAGCLNCYAERQAIRQSKPGQAYHGLVESTASGPRWTGKISLVMDKLEEPLRIKKPTKFFVNSMSDCFHEDVPFEFIKQMWDIMAAARQHTFMILTKRPERALKFAKLMAGADDISIAEWPRNVWLGVSVEDQKSADERIPKLLMTPAAVRWVSAEPLLSRIDLRKLHSPFYQDGHHIGREVYPLDGMMAIPDCDWEVPKINWVVAGAESGPGARPMSEEWVRALKNQCQAAAVPFFFKQDATVSGKKISLPILDGQQWLQYPEVNNNA